MSKQKLSVAAVIGFCGTCVAFYIGAGFASMQEVMQYEASYGSRFWVPILVAAVIYVYTNISFATNGNRKGLSRGGDIYQHYCGKYIGTFYDYFASIFCYMCFIVMCGGANSTAAQQFGLPNGVGAIILTIAVVITGVFGLNGIIKALGKIGPIIIIIIFVVATAITVTHFEDFSAGAGAIDAGEYDLVQVGNGNPFASGASYGGFVILWFAAFLSEIGAKNKLREVNSGMLISTVVIFGGAALCCIALISCIADTAYADIPALVLAGKLSPAFATVFALIIFAGIYTTAVPLLWTGIVRFVKEGSKSYKMWIIIGGAVGCVVACFLPYKSLVNILYGLNGYLGFILVAFMLVQDIRTRMSSRLPGGGAGNGGAGGNGGGQ